MHNMGGITAKLVPSLFAAANIKPPKMILNEAVELAATEPLRFQQVEQLLAALICEPRSPFKVLFERYAGPGGRMTLDQWQRFCAEEQGESDPHEAALMFATALEEHYGTSNALGSTGVAMMKPVSEDEDTDAFGITTHGSLTPLMFQNLLLSSSNRALCPQKAEVTRRPLQPSVPLPEALVLDRLVSKTDRVCHPPHPPPCRPVRVRDAACCAAGCRRAARPTNGRILCVELA